MRLEVLGRARGEGCSLFPPSPEEAEGVGGWPLTPASAPPAPGILWNLSSSDHLKDRLARDTLEQLTDLVLSPLSGAGGPPLIQQNASEAEIFYNATGFLRCAGRGRDAGPRQRAGAWGAWLTGPGAGDVGRPSGAQMQACPMWPPRLFQQFWGLQGQGS